MSLGSIREKQDSTAKSGSTFYFGGQLLSTGAMFLVKSLNSNDKYTLSHGDFGRDLAKHFSNVGSTRNRKTTLGPYLAHFRIKGKQFVLMLNGGNFRRLESALLELVSPSRAGVVDLTASARGSGSTSYSGGSRSLSSGYHTRSDSRSTGHPTTAATTAVHQQYGASSTRSEVEEGVRARRRAKVKGIMKHTSDEVMVDMKGCYSDQYKKPSQDFGKLGIEADIYSLQFVLPNSVFMDLWGAMHHSVSFLKEKNLIDYSEMFHVKRLSLPDPDFGLTLGSGSGGLRSGDPVVSGAGGGGSGKTIGLTKAQCSRLGQMGGMRRSGKVPGTPIVFWHDSIKTGRKAGGEADPNAEVSQMAEIMEKYYENSNNYFPNAQEGCYGATFFTIDYLTSYAWKKSAERAYKGTMRLSTMGTMHQCHSTKDAPGYGDRALQSFFGFYSRTGTREMGSCDRLKQKFVPRVEDYDDASDEYGSVEL